MISMAWRAMGGGGELFNVVIVTFDTTRADRIGYHGYERGRTPTLDALARDGVAYLRCYTPAPVTLPAHCSLMTGLTPLRHGVHDNGPDALASEVETLAEILARQGYTTAAFVGAFVLDRQFGLAQGFQHYSDDMTGGRQADQFCYAERNARLVTDAALNWLSKRTGEPTFVWIHYFDPHIPYEAPDFDPTFASLTAYDAEVRFADSQLKRVVEFFDKTGEPMLIIVAADHGEGLGDHGEPTHGMFTYNSTLHVPLVVRFPHQAGKGTRIHKAVSLVDVAPSVIEWLGLQLPPDCDGSPLPLVDDESQVDDGNPKGIYFENHFVANNYGWSPLLGAIWDDEKFIQAPRPELYDLARDQGESQQLYKEQSEKAVRVKKRFESLVADLRAQGVYSAQSVELTAADMTTLESLGYAGSREDSSAATTDDAAIDPDPKDMVDVLAKIHSATIAMEQQRYAEAAELLIQIASRDDPANPRAVKMLSALIAVEPTARPQIIDCLEQARRLGYDFDVHSLLLLGVGLLAEQQYEAATETLLEVTRSAPNLAVAYRYLGDAYRELRQFKEAEQSYQRAIQIAAHFNDNPDWLKDVRKQLQSAGKHIEVK
jgi:arylsulfatase A-like enzyme